LLKKIQPSDCETQLSVTGIVVRSTPLSVSIISSLTKSCQSINFDSNFSFPKQVIARENKSGNFGIDYKFSDMVSNYANPTNGIEPRKTSKSANQKAMTTRTTTIYTTTTTESTLFPEAEKYHQFKVGIYVLILKIHFSWLWTRWAKKRVFK